MLIGWLVGCSLVGWLVGRFLLAVGSNEFIKNGVGYTKSMGPKQRWNCKDCGRVHYTKINDKNVKESKTVRNKYPSKKKGKK